MRVSLNGPVWKPRGFKTARLPRSFPLPHGSSTRNATGRYAYKAKMPFLRRLGLTVASTPALVSAPFSSACFSAAANAWLAVISFSRSAAGSSGRIGGPDLLWWSYRKRFACSSCFDFPDAGGEFRSLKPWCQGHLRPSSATLVRDFLRVHEFHEREATLQLGWIMRSSGRNFGLAGPLPTLGHSYCLLLKPSNSVLVEFKNKQPNR